MPRAIQSSYFEPLIHGLDVMLAKAERVLTRERANADVGVVAVSDHRDLVNLPGVAEQVAAQYEDAAEARSVHLFVDVAPDALVFGNSGELHRVVEQLVAGALVDTPCGGWVAISGAVWHGVVTLTFSSHSPATSPEIRAHVPRGHDAGGRGWPFSASRFRPSEVGHILRACGGRLEVSNQPGECSRFEVRLPVG